MSANNTLYPPGRVILFYFEGSFDAFQTACAGCDLTDPDDPLARALTRLDAALVAAQPIRVEVTLASDGGAQAHHTKRPDQRSRKKT